uniref:Uncharacterized protein n=1 Tax=Oryza rufipogon TaxID=4529 RepID=A0A0E0PGV0_ORYRU
MIKLMQAKNYPRFPRRLACIAILVPSEMLTHHLTPSCARRPNSQFDHGICQYCCSNEGIDRTYSGRPASGAARRRVAIKRDEGVSASDSYCYSQLSIITLQKR